MMARTREEIISEMVDSGLFNDAEIRQAVAEADSSPTKTYTRGFVKTYEGKPKTLPQKLDVGAANTAEFLLNLGNAPFEMAGEAVAAPLEGRAPIRPTILGGNSPENPISVVNKLLRAGAGAASGIPSGTPGASARNAYNAPRGAMGAVEDTALAALLGKVAPEVLAAPADAATIGAKKVLQGGKNLGMGAVKKGVRIFLGPTEEAQNLLLNRPGDVARQKDFVELGDKAAKTINDLQGKLTELDNSAWDTLLKLKAEPQSKILRALKAVKKEFIGKGGSKISDADRAAAAQVDKYIERVQQISGDKYNAKNPGTEKFLDQEQLKEIVQSIRRDATYGLIQNEPVNRASKDAASAIDSLLKENGNYAEAMKPVAEVTAALTEAVDQFKLARDPFNNNAGLVPTKTTATRLKQLTEGKNPEVTRSAQQLKKVTGIDLADEAKLTAANEQFKPGAKANGSRRVMLGRAIGGGLSALVSALTGGSIGTDIAAAGGGGALGGMLGGASDYYGGPMAANILRLLSRTGSGVGKVLAAAQSGAQGTPYQEIIQRLIAGEPFLAPVLRGNR